MAFNYFLMGLCGIYATYYAAMFVVDLTKMKNDKNMASQGKEIDISDAVSTYKPKIAADIINKEAEELKAEMQKKEEEEKTAESQDDDSEFPFNMDHSKLFMSTAEEDEDTPSGGLNIQYEIGEEKKEEYPPVEMNGGYYASNIKKIMDEASGDNLFKDVRFVMAS